MSFLFAFRLLSCIEMQSGNQMSGWCHAPVALLQSPWAQPAPMLRMFSPISCRSNNLMVGSSRMPPLPFGLRRTVQKKEGRCLSQLRLASLYDAVNSVPSWKWEFRLGNFRPRRWTRSTFPGSRKNGHDRPPSCGSCYVHNIFGLEPESKLQDARGEARLELPSPTSIAVANLLSRIEQFPALHAQPLGPGRDEAAKWTHSLRSLLFAGCFQSGQEFRQPGSEGGCLSPNAIAKTTKVGARHNTLTLSPKCLGRLQDSYGNFVGWTLDGDRSILKILSRIAQKCRKQAPNAALRPQFPLLDGVDKSIRLRARICAIVGMRRFSFASQRILGASQFHPRLSFSLGLSRLNHSVGRRRRSLESDYGYPTTQHHCPGSRRRNHSVGWQPIHPRKLHPDSRSWVQHLAAH